MVNVFLIGISGGSCSGKTTLAKNLAARFGDLPHRPKVRIISEDDYYHDTQTLKDIEFYDGIYDDPIIRDHALLLQHLGQLTCGKNVQIPQYDFVNHCRSTHLQTVEPADIIITEGLHIYCNDDLCKLFDYKIFIEYDDAARFERRLDRDTKERGRSEESVHSQYIGVRNAYDKFIEPVKNRADAITQGNYGEKTLQKISQQIENRIKEKSIRS